MNSSLVADADIPKQLSTPPHLPKTYFLKRIFRNYSKLLLAQITLQYLNEGLSQMRKQALRDIYKSVYKVEPEQSQIYFTLFLLPWTFKFFCGIAVDLDFISYRAHFIFWSFLSIATQLLVALRVWEGPRETCFLIGVCSLASAFLDAVIDAISVKAGRVDPEHG